MLTQKYGQTTQSSQFPVDSSISLDGNIDQTNATKPSQLAINGDVQIAGKLGLSPEAISNLGSALTNKISIQATFPGSPQLGSGNISGTLGAGSFVGSGSQLSNLNASALSTGTVADARLSDNVTRLGERIPLSSLQGNVVSSINGLVNNGGNIDIIAGDNISITSDGTSITVNSTAVATGAVDTINVGSGLTGGGSGGTVTVGLDGSVVTLQGNTFNGVNQLVQLTGSALPALDGSLITNLNATQLASGTINDARLSSDVALQSGPNIFVGANSFTQPLGVVNLTSSPGITYALNAVVGPGTYTLCTTSGNCSGVGGGVTTGGGTSNTVAVFSGAQTIDNSSLTDTGSLTTFNTTSLFQPVTNATDIFRIASSTTVPILVANSTNARIALNQATASYTLDVNGDINSSTIIRVGGVPICGPLSGCVVASGSTNYIQSATSQQAAANFNIQTGSASSVVGILQGAPSQTADIFQARRGNNTVVAKIDATGNFTAVSLSGSGSNITNLNASNFASGTIADARLSANVTLQGNTFNGVSQLVQTTSGSELPVMSGVNLTNLNGSSIATGSVADARLSANVTLQGNTFNGISQLVQTTSGGILPALSGANLTSLNATSFSSGTLADARLSANVNLLNANQTVTGVKTFQLNSTSALQIQNQAGTSNLFVADSSNTRIGIGKTSPAYTLDVNGDINSSTNIRVGGVAVCTVSGCVAASGNSNYIQNSSSLQVAANLNIESASTGAITGVFKALSGQSVNIVNVVDGSNNVVASVGNAGKTVFKTTTDDLSGFQVQNSASQSLFNVDTTNTQVRFNSAASGELKGYTTNANSPATSNNGRHNAALTVVNGYMYALSGQNNVGGATGTAQYARVNSDGSVGSWATTTSLPTSVVAGAATYNGYIYVAQYAQLSISYARPNVDGTITSWTASTATIPDFDIHPSGNFVINNGYVYITNAGTSHRNIYYSKINADGSLSPFVTVTNAYPDARLYSSTVVSGGYLVTMAGYNGSNVDQSTVYTFALDPLSGAPGSVVTTSSLPSTGRAGSAFVLNGYVYYAGGGSAGVFYGKVSATGTISWTTANTTLGEVLQSNGTTVNNGYAYFSMGQRNGVNYSGLLSYVTGARVSMTGNLDLIGMGANGYSNGGSGSGAGGSLYASRVGATAGAEVNGLMQLTDSLAVTGNVTASSSVNATSAFLIQNSTSQAVFNANTSQRRLGINTTAPGASLDVQPTTTGDIGLYIKQVASSTADLLQFNDSTDAIGKFGVDVTGKIVNGDAFGGPPDIGVEAPLGNYTSFIFGGSGGAPLSPYFTTHPITGNYIMNYNAGYVTTSNLARTAVQRCYYPGGGVPATGGSPQQVYIYATNTFGTNGRICAMGVAASLVYNAKYPFVVVGYATVTFDAFWGYNYVGGWLPLTYYKGGELVYVKTAAAYLPGTMVVNDTSADNQVISTTTAAANGVAGVIVSGSTSAGGQAIMMRKGIAQVNAISGTVRGACFQTSTTTGRGTSNATPVAGTCLGQSIALPNGNGGLTIIVRVRPY